MSYRPARLTHLAACALALAFLPLTADAQDVPVDVELVLAVDVSLSMSPDELVIQRDGYAAALTDEAVLSVIASGAHGKVAVTYIEWAGESAQHVVVPWTVIAGRPDAEAFVTQMTTSPPRSARRTSIAAALEFSATLFETSGYRGIKRVIDVSGDGPNNQGGAVNVVRDRIIQQGIVINGLPLMTTGGFNTPFDISGLDSYYADCVIGGPGAFMIPVNSWTQFPEAIRRKLVLELADSGSQRHAVEEAQGIHVIRVAAQAPTDCQIGEKLWQSRGWMDFQ
ncbi:MAG: DUF1194 domain-containing protein [Mesorhizobium sp.]